MAQRILIAGLMAILAASASRAFEGQSTGPKSSTASTSAAKRVTLAEALSASQSKRKAVEFYKDNGERGVLQQQVFDLVRDKAELQIALVVDGTDSMGQDLQSLKSGLKDFVSQIRSKRSGVMTEVAVVVYRDLGAASGPVTIATPDDQDAGRGIFWDASSPELAAVIDGIQTESGTPRFPEQVDRGLYSALTQLNWSRSPGAARSIILAGDAPPFDELDPPLYEPGFDEVLRKHTTDELVRLAKERQISIFSILCNAGFSDSDDQELLRVAELLRPRMRTFAQILAAETGGKVLDLADPHLADELTRDGDQVEQLTQLKKIEAADLEKRVQSDVVRVAVLPAVPMNVLREGTSGWSKTAGYTYACAIVNRLSEVDTRGVVHMSPLLWDKFSLVNLRMPKDATPQQILKDLASPESLDLDFVLWGEYPTPASGRHEITLRVFDRQGNEVANSGTVEGASMIRLVEPSLTKLAETLQANAGQPQPDVIQGLTQLLIAPGQLRQDEGWHEALLEGYRLAEESTAFELGNPKSGELNRQAIEVLSGYLKMRENDPLALLLRSSCYRNLGDHQLANSDLSLAQMFRAQADDAVALEIAADFALFAENDPFAAVARYEELVKLTHQRNRIYCRQALRAKWMLSGLYLGGWGFAETSQFKTDEAQYLDKARELILDVLVYWPESAEAEYYDRYVEPRPIRKPRKLEEKRQISFRLPAEITPPKNGGRVAMNNYDEAGPTPGGS